MKCWYSPYPHWHYYHLHLNIKHDLSVCAGTHIDISIILAPFGELSSPPPLRLQAIYIYTSMSHTNTHLDIYRAGRFSSVTAWRPQGGSGWASAPSFGTGLDPQPHTRELAPTALNRRMCTCVHLYICTFVHMIRCALGSLARTHTRPARLPLESPWV